MWSPPLAPASRGGSENFREQKSCLQRCGKFGASGAAGSWAPVETRGRGRPGRSRSRERRLLRGAGRLAPRRRSDKSHAGPGAARRGAPRNHPARRGTRRSETSNKTRKASPATEGSPRRQRGAPGRNRRPGPTPGPPAPRSLTVRGRALRRGPRAIAEASGCRALSRRRRALHTERLPTGEETDLSLPEPLPPVPSARPARPRRRLRGAPGRRCEWLGPAVRAGGGRQPAACGGVRSAQPPVGGEWGGRGAPPAGLEGVLLPSPRRPGRDAGRGPGRAATGRGDPGPGPGPPRESPGPGTRRDCPRARALETPGFRVAGLGF